MRVRARTRAICIMTCERVQSCVMCALARVRVCVDSSPLEVLATCDTGSDTEKMHRFHLLLRTRTHTHTQMHMHLFARPRLKHPGLLFPVWWIFHLFFSSSLKSSVRKMVFLWLTAAGRREMKAISVELNRRTHFLKAALCSQTWCHGMSGCMCTSHMHTGTLSALTLLFVCICELCRRCVLAFCPLVSPRLLISKCISTCLCVNVVIRVQICVRVCVKQRGWGGAESFISDKVWSGKGGGRYDTGRREGIPVTGPSAGQHKHTHTRRETHSRLVTV